MPRWKALPEELDPQVREFAGQLRRLVDHSGLSVFAVADRTGYSKTSWERYLAGRLLPPKGAVVALAEATGTDPVRLVALWEPAERAWSRTEMQHDMTTQAARIPEVRTSPGEPQPGAARTPGTAGEARTGLPGTVGPAGEFGPATEFGSSTAGGPPGAGRPDAQRRRRLVMFLAGLAGALVVIGVAFLLTGGEGTKSAGAPAPAPTSASASTNLPAGVRCGGADCTGKDPEKMGCGGTQARSTATATVGTTLVEVRYSRTCGTAWARITRAAPGDTVEVSASGSVRQTGSVTGAADTDAYTPMVSVKDPAAAKACVTLASGRKGCTK
ncbi:XRE family transcriptional regulator [Streptomyces gibsoniae]|uniref:XRE family transcriptional regulator n=1 Tax=Streptomyces gibsoniae TaxID=3075529 RepID=A0ABU2TLK1_9ACTN|nr:XRE family transcriptional regulator [Streptomyces sp. DSM 41699]MDT0461809.1 XRE family transcriptional regulator [Streptomyces sp. DSM 41699]